MTLNIFLSNKIVTLSTCVSALWGVDFDDLSDTIKDSFRGFLTHPLYATVPSTPSHSWPATTGWVLSLLLALSLFPC